RALTSEKERKIRMVQLRTVSKREKILFPVVLLLLVALLLPDAAPLLGMFCFGNLMRESGVVERLSDTVQNGLINIVTIFLGLSVGAKLVADKFLQPQTLGILLLGVIAFGIGTAAGVLMAKLLNLCSKNKINPLIGSAGVSAVPMAARVSNKVGPGVGRTELPADARDGPERGGGYRFGHCRGRDAQVRAGNVIQSNREQ
ncbi:putative sodium ion pump oxaloacetate decarboxylase beta chain, partial [Salmonella enterica subsp. enterica serovar Stanley str. ATCC 7308]